MTEERRMDRRATVWLIGAMVVVWLCTIAGCGSPGARVAAALEPRTAHPDRQDAVEVQVDAERSDGRDADVRGVSLADPPGARRVGRAGWSG